MGEEKEKEKEKEKEERERGRAECLSSIRPADQQSDRGEADVFFSSLLLPKPLCKPSSALSQAAEARLRGGGQAFFFFCFALLCFALLWPASRHSRAFIRST